jgi:hypothetical protein
MDEDKYNEIVKNIEKKEKYIIKKGILYKIKEDKLLRVIRRYEFEGLMYMMHNHELSAHFGIKLTQDKIREKYYWKNMAKYIEIYVKLCDNCQRRRKLIEKNELHPIKVKEPFYQIGIDFVRLLPITEKENKYIIVAINILRNGQKQKQ